MVTLGNGELSVRLSAFLLGPKAPSHKMQSVCLFVCFVCFAFIFNFFFFFWGGGPTFVLAQYDPYFVTVSVVHAKWPTLAWFVWECINKRYQTVESPSHVHRSSANY